MKIDKKITVEKTIVEQMRAIRDRINLEIKDLPKDQLDFYWSKQKTLHPAALWEKSINKI
jgi:hypothetical protein